MKKIFETPNLKFNQLKAQNIVTASMAVNPDGATIQGQPGGGWELAAPTREINNHILNH